MDKCKMMTVRELVSAYDPAPSGYYDCFFNLSIKNDIRIFNNAAELHNQVAEDLKALDPEGHFLTECLFQPLPKQVGKRSAERGTKITGVSNQPEDGVLWVAIIVIKKAEHEKAAHEILRKWGESVRDYALTIENGLLPWAYMNYADHSQQPLESYGKVMGKRTLQSYEMLRRSMTLLVFFKSCLLVDSKSQLWRLEWCAELAELAFRRERHRIIQGLIVETRVSSAHRFAAASSGL